MMAFVPSILLFSLIKQQHGSTVIRQYLYSVNMPTVVVTQTDHYHMTTRTSTECDSSHRQEIIHWEMQVHKLHTSVLVNQKESISLGSHNITRVSAGDIGDVISSRP